MTTEKPEFAFRTETDVVLKSVKFRKEIHGEEHRQAVDLTMKLDVPNTRLDDFIPGLREALYYNHSANTGQADIEGVPATLPNLRWPNLNEGKFLLDGKKLKLAGFDLFITYGIGDDESNMHFDCCKIVKREILVKEGGTVELKFTVQYTGDRLDQETLGKLALLEQDEITIRLIPPVVGATSFEPEDGPENPLYMGEDDDPDAGATPEDLFLAGAETDQAAETALLESDAR